MNVREIVEKYLRENKYDGLAGDECGCDIDDLMVCESECQGCVAGHKVLVKDMTQEEKYNLGCECDYVIKAGQRIKSLEEGKEAVK